MDKPDARTDRDDRHEYAVQLIAAAAKVCGSRNRLAERSGIGRRRLGYIEAGDRRHGSTRLQVRMSFAEQVILEAIASERLSEDQPSGA